MPTDGRRSCVYLDLFVAAGRVTHGVSRSCGRCTDGFPRRGEKPHDLVVWSLREVLVELTDREELLGRVQRDHLVGVVLQRRDRVGRRDGRRDDDSGGTLGACDLARGAYRRAGRDAVVDDQRDAAGERARVDESRGTVRRGARAPPPPAFGPRRSRPESHPSAPRPGRSGCERHLRRSRPSRARAGYGTPSLRTTMMSSGTSSSRATSNATGTPPRGSPSTTRSSRGSSLSRSASRRPASTRSTNNMTLLLKP